MIIVNKEEQQMNEQIKELEKQLQDAWLAYCKVNGMGHPLQDAWLAYCKVNGMGHPLHSMNRETYATFKDGWNAALAAIRART